MQPLILLLVFVPAALRSDDSGRDVEMLPKSQTIVTLRLKYGDCQRIEREIEIMRDKGNPAV